MKKLALLIFCVMIFLSSCKPEPAELQTDLHCVITAECNSILLKAEVEADGNNMLDIKILKPDTVKGYSYYYSDGRLRVDCRDMTIDTEYAYLPDTSFPNIMYYILGELCTGDGCKLINSINNKAIYKGKCKLGEFIVTADYSTGEIKQIKLTDGSFKAKFRTVK